MTIHDELMYDLRREYEEDRAAQLHDLGQCGGNCFFCQPEDGDDIIAGSYARIAVPNDPVGRQPWTPFSFPTSTAAWSADERR